MKIGVISDTHDRLPPFRRALALFKRWEVDALLHAGDYVAPFAAKLLLGSDAPPPDRVPLYCIYGNNDGEREGLKKLLPQLQDGPLRVELGGRTIVMHHWIQWLKPDETDAADIVITGHTHEVVHEHREDKLYLNPGECCGWLTGRCTVAVLDTQRVQAEIVELEGQGAGSRE